MATVTSNELYREFGKVLDRVYRGEEIDVTRYGRPYVRLLPPETTPPEDDRHPSE
jgi:prevent-host-death family protein